MDAARKRTWAEIDLSALSHNYHTIRASLPEGCRFLCVIKAPMATVRCAWRSCCRKRERNIWL